MVKLFNGTISDGLIMCPLPRVRYYLCESGSVGVSTASLGLSTTLS